MRSTASRRPFDQANQWFDQPRNQELVNKLLEKKSNYTSYAETGTSRNRGQRRGW